MAATFRIASSNIIKTAAERRLPSTDSVLMMVRSEFVNLFSFAVDNSVSSRHNSAQMDRATFHEQAKKGRLSALKAQFIPRYWLSHAAIIRFDIESRT